MATLKELADRTGYSPATISRILSGDPALSVTPEARRKVLEEAGRLNVPGRPIQYKTTPDFLRTFGLSTLEELPPIEKVSFGEPVEPEQTPDGEEA